MTEAIIDILVNDSNVQTLVGRNEEDDKYKIYPLMIPQKESAPFIAVRLISRPPIPCKGQRPSAFTPVCMTGCYAVNYVDALALETAVIDALDGKPAGTYNGKHLTYLRYIDTSEDWINNDGAGLYVRMPQFEAQEDASEAT